MEDRVRTRLSDAALRRFGLTLAVAFGLVAAWLWRGRPASAIGIGLGALAATLLTLALVAPRLLAGPERAWMAIAHAISRVTTPIILGIIYFLVITPIGLLRRLLGHGTLGRRVGGPGLAPGGTWVIRADDHGRSDLDRQF